MGARIQPAWFGAPFGRKRFRKKRRKADTVPLHGRGDEMETRNEGNEKDEKDKRDEKGKRDPVSYTHLTLPTN